MYNVHSVKTALERSGLEERQPRVLVVLKFEVLWYSVWSAPRDKASPTCRSRFTEPGATSLIDVQVAPRTVVHTALSVACTHVRRILRKIVELYSQTAAVTATCEPPLLHERLLSRPLMCEFTPLSWAVKERTSTRFCISVHLLEMPPQKSRLSQVYLSNGLQRGYDAGVLRTCHTVEYCLKRGIHRRCTDVQHPCDPCMCRRTLAAWSHSR